MSDTTSAQVLEGSCHCGALRWKLAGIPEAATACNCTACRRYGALWAYGFENDSIHAEGVSKAYVRGRSLEFHFCPECGNLGYWRGQRPGNDGRRRMAVNLRLTEPGPIARVPIQHFDGLDTWEDLPVDGRCVADYWF